MSRSRASARDCDANQSEPACNGYHAEIRRRLAPVIPNFCGACHRTRVDVAIELPRHMGVSAARLQPYRWKGASAGAAEAIRGLRASPAMTRTNRLCVIPQVTMPTVSSATQNQGTSRKPSWVRPAPPARRIASPAICRKTRSPGCTRHTLTISFQSSARIRLP